VVMVISFGEIIFRAKIMIDNMNLEPRAYI
jgi:hypothetical protein